MKNVRIDVHHHFLTPQYIEELAKVGIVESGGLPFPRWKPEDSLAVLDRSETQVALLSLSSPGLCFGNTTKEREVARALNEFAAQCVTRWPNRFGFFATLPLSDVQAALTEISYALDTLHADGVGLLSNYAGTYLGDARFNAIFAELDRRAAAVFIHPTVFTGSEIPAAENAGSPIPTLPGFLLEFVFDTTRAVANLVLSGTLKEYSQLRIILSHAGGTIPFVANKIVSAAILRAFGTQVSKKEVLHHLDLVETVRQTFTEDVFSQLRELYYDTALSANMNVFSSLRQLVPVSHILLGTDYPFAPEIEAGFTASRLAHLSNLNEQERQDIEGNNALNLFPRLQALE